MPDPNTNSAPQDNVQVVTTAQQHAEVAGKIAGELGSVLGSTPSIDDLIPASEKEPASDQEYFNPSDFQERTNRILFNKPGFEPSKNFLSKMMEKMHKKNPGAQVTLKGEE